jgi:glycosyltransferase involved in cell wall biosynthesis
MRLGFFCNFSHRHVGGSEIVLKHISERLVKNYNYEVNVYSFSCDASFQDNGVNYFRCDRGDGFISQVSQNDCIMVYSDSFWEFDTLVKNIDRVNCKICVALVGAYHLQSHPEIFSLLKNNTNRFNLITHSSLNSDYKWCQSVGLGVRVIPNGVDLSEFENNKVNFREKYDIKANNIILNVSSFFFGKGQVYLPKICDKLACPKFGTPKGVKCPRDMRGYGRSGDFCLVSISNTVKYPHEKMFLDRFKRTLEKQEYEFEYKVLRDIPREDVVAAFLFSSVFLFTSLKEVSPIVILEAMASGTPWVSMDVGCLEEYIGGLDGITSPGNLIRNNKLDVKGNKVITTEIISEYASCVNSLLSEYEIRSEMARAGNDLVESKYSWDKIVELYHNVFT